MDTTGLEPVTPTMSTWCSNQLSYASVRRFINIAWLLGNVQGEWEKLGVRSC